MTFTPFITRRLLRSLGIALMLFYFGFHMLHGDQGLVGRMIEQHKQQKLHKEIAIVKAERERLEHRISLISGQEIDADLLQELAKQQLPVIGEREILLTK